MARFSIWNLRNSHFSDIVFHTICPFPSALTLRIAAFMSSMAMALWPHPFTCIRLWLKLP